MDLPEPAAMGTGSPFQRQRAGEKKRETATAAEENPSWEAAGQGVQRGHGSGSDSVRPSGCRAGSALLRGDKAALAPRRAGQSESSTRAASLTFAVILDVLCRR